MSNDIDTTAIRAAVGNGPKLFDMHGDCDAMILMVCDALDEARAERDGWKLAAGHRMELLIEREERIEELESRIAAALVVNQHCECGNSTSVYSALTEGDQ